MTLRRTSLKRKPMRRSWMKRSGRSPRKEAAAAALKSAAPIAVARAGGRCERCQVATDLQLHHRLRRSAADRERPSNYLMLCLHCHTGGDDSVHANPVKAREFGWILSPHQEPSKAPVYTWHGWVLFADDGSIDTHSLHVTRPEGTVA
ncbi:hypothetical protein P3H15_27400 [Rhodococcus sp. T2V]|uniref:hypothetical protein n=1 Tax=Rhodococcus sp. T2V TaxID=3034164 RepID=UPI0023E22CD1|nr:hypothetical protein [Rhodococcus sp. T2V]MDF3308749.1 hypothetical protein [Rhodococcus sp. T2V]